MENRALSIPMERRIQVSGSAYDGDGDSPLTKRTKPVFSSEVQLHSASNSS